MSDPIREFVDAVLNVLKATQAEILDKLFLMIDEIDAVSVSIINKAGASVTTLIEASESALYSITSKVTNPLDLSNDDITRAVNTLTSNIHNDIMNVYNEAKNALDAYNKKVIDVVDEDLTDTEKAEAAAAAGIVDFNDGVISDILPGVDPIIEKALAELPTEPQKGFLEGIGDLSGIVEGIKSIPKAITLAGSSLALFSKLADLTKLMHSPDQQIKMIEESMASSSATELQMRARPAIAGIGAAGGIMGSPFGFFPFFSSVFSSGPGAVLDNISRSAWTPARLSLQDLVTAYIRGKIDIVKLYDDASQLGFGNNDTNVAVDLARHYLQAQDLMTLWLRNELTDEVLTDRMAEIGVRPEQVIELMKLTKQILPISDMMTLWMRGNLTDKELDARLSEIGIWSKQANELKSLAYFIPQVNDLIHMAVREAFTPEIAEKFGQYEDFPEAVAEWGEKQGLSREWAQRYWAAHWDLPSPQMGFEMFQRKIIDIDTLKILLRALDIMPYWRDKLIQLAYQPITRVDIRRMHKLMHKDHQWLVDRYEAVGYSPADAEEQAIFTEELNKEEIKLETQAQRDLTASEITNAYANSAIGESETRSMLSELGYDENDIELKLVLAELPILKAIRDKKIAIINQRLLYGAIDLNGAVDALGKMEMSANEMDYVLADWQLDLELQQLKAEAASAKAKSGK